MNFYEYLGISHTASTAEIKKAFRKKAKRAHPDYNKKDSAFFEMVQLNMIRDTLLIPSKRAEYDKALQSGQAAPSVEIRPQTHRRASRLQKMYAVMKELFTYRCRICGMEMSSTWSGYCLFHFLEVSGQLHNPDYTFQYHGYTYRYTTPQSEKYPEEDSVSSKETSRRPTRNELIFIIGSILIVTILIMVSFMYLYTQWRQIR